jgi:hypothetical protein
MPLWPFKSSKRKKALDDFLQHERKEKRRQLKELGTTFKDAACASRKFVVEVGAPAK